MIMADFPVLDTSSLVRARSRLDDAWRRYHLAKTDPEVEAACRDVEVADKALDRMMVQLGL